MALAGPVRSESLRGQARRAGAALVLSALLPIHDRGAEAFMWELSDPAPGPLLSALTPALGGFALLAAARLSRDNRRTALLLLLTVATLQGLASVAGALAPWNVLPLDGSFTGSPAALLALSLALAATSGRGHPPASPPERRSWLMFAGGLVLLYYVVPTRGEAPALSLWRELHQLTTSAVPHRALRPASISATLLVPAVLILVASLASRRQRIARPALDPRLQVASPLALTHLLVACVLLAARAAAGWQSPRAFLGAAAGCLVLGTMLSSTASAIVAWNTLRRERRGRALGEALGAMLLLLVGLSGAGAWARRQRSSEPWTPGPPSAAAERVFAVLLPDWNDALAREALTPAPTRDSAQRGQQLVEAAMQLDSALGVALVELTSRAVRRPREGSWYRRVATVNEALRRAGLPYYVDPTAAVMLGPGPRPLFMRLDAYRIERSGLVRVGSRQIGHLSLRRMRRDRGGPAVLGLSRDLQPLALVVLDEIEASARELRRLADAEPARCASCPPDDAPCRTTSERCGARLRALAARAELGTLLADITQRHELQHQIDGPELARAVRTLRLLREYDRGAQAEVNRELSALLAQMTVSAAGAELTLVRLTRSVTLGRRGPEFYAAWLALEALSGPELRCARGERACVLEASAELARLEGRELAARAGRAYEEEFGRSLEQPRPLGAE